LFSEFTKSDTLTTQCGSGGATPWRVRSNDLAGIGIYDIWYA